jgi:hypothetical protein
MLEINSLKSLTFMITQAQYERNVSSVPIVILRMTQSFHPRTNELTSH